MQPPQIDNDFIIILKTYVFFMYFLSYLCGKKNRES
jgi:hypothetical protein